MAVRLFHTVQLHHKIHLMTYLIYPVDIHHNILAYNSHGLLNWIATVRCSIPGVTIGRLSIFICRLAVSEEICWPRVESNLKDHIIYHQPEILTSNGPHPPGTRTE
jgi:hypothetical protein